MTGWDLIVAFDVLTAFAYIGIVSIIVRGLVRTGQAKRNRLARATAAIFFSSAAYHTVHAILLLTAGSQEMASTRDVVTRGLDVLITAFAALAGLNYLLLRRHSSVLPGSPAMFSDAAESRYRQLVANLPHTAVLVVDMDLRFVLAGGAGLEDAGYDPSDLEGRLVADVLSPSAYTELGPHYRATIAGGSIEFDASSSVTGKTFHTRGRPMLDGAGTVVGGFLLAEDVTAKRAADAQLEQAHGFNAAILAASPDLTFISDVKTGEVQWSSRDIWQMLGWSTNNSAVDERPALGELVAPEDRERISRTNAAVALLADGENVTIRYRVRSPDGYRWLSRQSTPFFRDAGGQILRCLSVIRDVTDVVEVEDRMQHAALHDPLTGLPNRALLVDRLNLALTRADRLDTEVVVLFCDLDGFKRVNDTDGHAAGDAVLVEVAHRLRDVLRKSDSVARVGGDEFVVVLEPTGRRPDQRRGEPPSDHRADRAPNAALRSMAAMIANRVRSEVSRPVVHLGRQHVISVSVGMTFAPRGSRADDVLSEADAAMYRAKQRGKDRVVVFDKAQWSDKAENGRIERMLRQTLLESGLKGTGRDSQEFAPIDPVHMEFVAAELIGIEVGEPSFGVAYQPIYDLADRHLVGFEALARLSDPSGEAVTPAVFLPIAEAAGLMPLLGRRVTDEALGCLAGWRAGHPDDVPATMSVNFSATQVRHPELPELIEKALERHGLRHEALALELAESVLLESTASTLNQLAELRAGGVGIAIDAFGTGYASLRHLATLAVSSVKVDRSFTATVATDRTCRAIVDAIAALAADLGLSCVVGGIESGPQLQALPPGVLGQGFLLGRPAAVLDNSWATPAP